MPQEITDKSQSIIETSLTELVFIFFFVLLVFAALKIKEVNDEKEDYLQKTTQLASTIQHFVDLIDVSAPLHSKNNASRNHLSEVDLNKVFTGLKRIEQNVSQIIEEHSKIESQLARSGETIESVTSAIENIKQLFDESKASEPLKNLVASLDSQIMSLQGQNLNLREKLADEGNGLVHPPCWADPTTGDIEYIYHVTINESSMTLKPAWPANRSFDVDSNPDITAAVGTYDQSAGFWNATRSIYRNSLEQECRHFVLIEDQAVSKESFKKYLLTAERHFYKRLL
ncbi:hypothetical protein [Pseudidiomarina terrestris]|uniref:hypothetical protein n=1 Tax=Pseudidiomarina terrestris TaxID=2820060 RepID=UPI00264DDA93|nr:hypothetical protein [Pseudidiomarina sp. 1ASP75-5]MDN7135364.1 hypothetical protein [Pseudidiomarina sp. 1ASP75-5]